MLLSMFNIVLELSILMYMMQGLRGRYLVGGVVHDKIHHKLHVALFELGNQLINVLNRTIRWVYGFVVGNIVSHISLRAFVYCQKLE